MRMDRVRIDERFVLNDRGGVWEKISDGRARCVYGEAHGTEIEVPPDTPVYVHFGDNRGPRRYDRPRYDRPREQAPRRDAPVEREDEAGNKYTTSEGTAQKGGVNSRPTTPPPPSPQGQGGQSKQEPVHMERIKEGIEIVLLDEDENVITAIPAATAAQVVAYTSVDAIKMRWKGEQPEAKVMGTLFDRDTQTVYVSLGIEA